MTIQEACQRLGKSESTIRRMIKTGKLAADFIDGKYDIHYVLPDDQSLPSQTTIQNDQLIIQLRAENEYLKTLLSEAQQARERADTIMLSQSRQLEQKAIEAPRVPWIKRIFTKKPT